MPIVSCPTCTARLRVGDEHIGKKGRCPKCSTMFLLAVPDEIAVLTVVDPTPPKSTTADLRPARFLADLAVVHAGLAIRNPVDDLPTLARLFDARRQAISARSRRFAADLREVYATVAPPDLEAHLPALSQTLSQWRTRTRSRVATYFSQLPADDPLLCPISLFGVMERGRLDGRVRGNLANSPFRPSI